MLDGNRTAARLSAYLAACTERAVPFAWGAHNCCHFAAGWVFELTGQHPMQAFASTPSLHAARRALAPYGGSLQAAITHALQCAPLAPSLAQTGDVLLLPASGLLGAAPGPGVGFVVGLCSGRHAVLQGADGSLVFEPAAQALCAWRPAIGAAP